MSSHKNFCALTVSMIVGASCCVPTYAQHKMSLKSLFDLADRQNQRIKVSEAALKAAEEGLYRQNQPCCQVLNSACKALIRAMHS
jgi:hypothetical protein